MRPTALALIVTLLLCGCANEPLPPVPSPHPVRVVDRYPTSSYNPLPLDLAIGKDDLEAVRGLLDTGADPGARWGDRGDHHPLQEAIEPYQGFYPRTHSTEIVELLLAHGADPNARWCPFESRMSSTPGWISCTSGKGMTPLIMAALSDQSETVKVLLAAGADPRLKDWLGISAIGRAHAADVFDALGVALFPSEADRSRRLLTLIQDEEPSWMIPTPWNDTVISRVFLGDGGMTPPPPPPPPPPSLPQSPPQIAVGRNLIPDYFERRNAGRMRWLLSIGANPNERITLGGVDWTPLQLALSSGQASVAEVLLEAGADPDARWCYEVDDLATSATRTKDPSCTIANGTTPLFWAKKNGRVDFVDLLLAHGAR